jgi:hypothetical protein
VKGEGWRGRELISRSTEIAICRSASSLDEPWAIHLQLRGYAWIGKTVMPRDAAIALI